MAKRIRNAEPPPYRVHDAARELGVHDEVIRDALRRGRLKGYLLSPRLWLIPRTEIDRIKYGETAQ